ncbi:MAG: tRNA lysidine(34) synthetase TilS [Acidimicrobiales bacterium]
MGDESTGLLDRCHFPPRGTRVDLAVSGGADSTALLLLALAAGLLPTVHHVDHGSRAASAADSSLVEALGAGLGVSVVVRRRSVERGPNFESRARAARRAALPRGVLTGHTMDDLAETVLINLMRGAGFDGLAPMAGDPTKPMRDLRRAEVRDYVERSGFCPATDETNDDPAFARNRVRHEVLPLLNDVARRDVVPVLARGAALMAAEREWLDALGAEGPALDDVDCRELATWPVARLRRWLRSRLASADEGDGVHPPSAAEVERVIAVVRGDAVAAELSGARRVARRGQRLVVD